MIDGDIIGIQRHASGIRPKPVDSHSFLKKTKPVSVASQVTESIRNAILSGQFKPGERLVERRLAEAVGSSLTSIRDALQQLDREGLVSRKANTGTFVTELSPKKLADMIEVRLLLEPRAMTLASRNMTQNDSLELQRMADEIERLATDNDFYHVSRSDFAFHQRVWQISGNESLEKLLSQLCSPMFAFLMILNSVKQQNLAGHLMSHHILVDALNSRDERKVDACVRAHILTSKPVLLNQA
jgi:DNA-binding GntR family transcriptional regulator